MRSWAERLDCPILSIDYSLAPEFPYPRALDECYYAVSWAIRNRRQLGCTSDAKIVLCGDSAGANLALCSTLKSIEYRTAIPDAIFLAYVPVLVAMTPSPARLLASIDPLLPVGILARCLLGILVNIIIICSYYFELNFYSTISIYDVLVSQLFIMYKSLLLRAS